jgi:N-acyl-D-amino-acid deacylase
MPAKMVGVFDLVVRGGWVHDGTGAPPVRADVGVIAGRIATLGKLDGVAAGTVVDAGGRYVLPGFVDAHSHADAAILDSSVAHAELRQGVTTLVFGQDGLSYAPSSAAALAFVNRYFAAINGAHPGLDPGGASVAELRSTWHRRTAVNTAYLLPHGTIRFSAMGGAPRPAEADELAAMRQAVERGLAEGAVGLSSGLEYLPGRYADVAELAELCRPVAAAGLPYVTHMRGYGLDAPDAAAEARAIGVAAGVAVHMSHYHGPGAALSSIVDGYRVEGLDLTFDAYPYRRGCTILAMAALPRWLDDTDLDKVTSTLAADDVRARVASGLNPDLLSRITLAHVPSPEWAWTEGLALTEAAARAGRPAAEVLLDLLVGTRMAASGVIAQPASTDRAALPMLLRHPCHVGGSDGIYVGGHPHPRGWGSFARFLGRHVRERGDWSWPEAAVHLAAHPARRFGLTDRGVLRPGLAADIAVVDPATVADRATYAQPRTLAVGVDDVIVNGVAVLRDGELTGALAGEALSPVTR